MKINFTLLLVLFLSFFSFGQNEKVSIKNKINFSDLPKQNSQTPSWALPFYSNPDDINVFQMKKEIDTWIKSEDAKRYGKEVLIKERKAKGKISSNFSHEKLRESITEIPIVRFSLNFFKRIPSHWIDESGKIKIPSANISNRNLFQESSVNSPLNTWAQIGPMETVGSDGIQKPNQSNVYFIAVSPSTPSTWMASTETRALFKTTDSGNNWSFIADYSGPIAFNPTNSNNVIIASNPIRESNDGGLTWDTKAVTASCNEVVWSTNGNIILVASNQGIHVSNNGGTTFTNNLSGDFYDVEFMPGSSTIAYAINVDGNFYKTTNAGATWTLKTTNYSLTTSKDGYLLGVSSANPNLVSIAFLTGENVELLKSTNSGEAFTQLSVLNSGFSQGFYDFAFGISPTNSNIYYVGVTTLFKSTDGGLNFSALGGYEGSFNIHPDIQDIDFNGNTVVLSTDGGISVSSDNFTNVSNWHSANKGLFDLELWAFDQGFNTDQMGSGKYHNGDNIYNPIWNNGKTIHLGGAESPVGYSIFSRPNSMFYADIYQGFYQADTQYNPNVERTYSFSMNSNNFYYGERNSDITSNVVNSNIIYAAYENKVYISYDNGISNQVLKTFNSTVWNIKPTRSNPNVIYITTENDGLWKTIDGGQNWTQLDFILNGNNYNNNGLQCFIDVSQTNENELWLAYINWNGNYSLNNSYRIFKSTNGGTTWNSIDSSVLNGFTVKEMAHQYGTNGGVYLIGYDSNSIAKCYYRNNTMTNWVDYSSGLMSGSLLANRIYLKLSHFQEKVRAAGDRGIQEIQFYESYVAPIAQPTVNNREVCINQEVKLADYSILKYAGATWNWSFSKNPIYLNGTTATSQNPEVKFLTPGSVDVTLTVNDSSGSSNSKTITNFINVNYDSAACLMVNSDPDLVISCQNNISASSYFLPGNNRLVTNFGGATSGEFIVKVNFNTQCYNVNGQLTAIVNLFTQKITVIQYKHFDNASTGIIGNNTNTITSLSDAYAQISFSLNATSLYLNHISNACGNGTSIRLLQSCWKPYTGIDNGDSVEIQKCDVAIPASGNVALNNSVLISNFNNATSGLFFVEINGHTSCNNSSNKVKAIINLDSDTINVLQYNHFGQTLTSNVTANETSSVNSLLTANGQVNYYLNNNILYAKLISASCGSSTFNITTSCWSSMDSDNNGIDNTVQPVTCNNSISTSQFTDTNLHEVQNFNSVYAQQTSVFVRLNIATSCNSTQATAYLNIDLENNVIHIISYSHFGSTTSSTVVNNNSANVYSESAAYGKLKFSLINKVLYVQRLSTDCAGSTYQIIDSCYSLASDEMLAINDFVSNIISEIIAYPNPTTSVFSIKPKDSISNYTFSFYTLDGKFITPIVKETTTNEVQVSLDGFPTGIYFVILHDKSKSKHEFVKIIKK